MSEIVEPKPESVEHDEKAEKQATELSDEKEESVNENSGEDGKIDDPQPQEGKTELENAAQDDSAIDVSVNPVDKSEDAVADDEESDSDESLPPGLLERPVEILENKRERKKITRFSYDDEKPSPAADKKNVVDIPKGIGIPLKEHPRVEYQLARNPVEDLKIIHKFFYGVPGANHLVKKNIREFCGFVLDKDSPQYEKKEEIIGRFTVDNLKWAMTVLDVPLRAKGKKEDLMEAFMDWAMCPKPQDKPVPGKKEKKSAAESGKKKIKVKRSAKKMENGDTASDATPVKKPKKSKKKSSEKSAKIKFTSPKSKSKVSDEESSDDEPLDRKNTAPSNKEIKKFVETLLKDADLEVLTMKVVFQRVYEKYPGHDLTDRKSFIKETVKKIIS